MVLSHVSVLIGWLTMCCFSSVQLSANLYSFSPGCGYLLPESSEDQLYSFIISFSPNKYTQFCAVHKDFLFNFACFFYPMSPWCQPFISHHNAVPISQTASAPTPSAPLGTWFACEKVLWASATTSKHECHPDTSLGTIILFLSNAAYPAYFWEVLMG